jgi:hypothetical protein
MLDWNVVKREGAAAGGAGSTQALRSRRRWLILFGALTALFMAVGTSFWYAARAAEARQIAVLEQTVRDEANALYFGVTEQANEWLDPAASPAWQFCYESSFRATAPGAPTAEIEGIERSGDLAQVELRYAGRDEADAPGFQSITRNYRLVRDRWRRTPLNPVQGDDDSQTGRVSEGLTSPHFHMLPTPAGIDLSMDLENLRELIIARWPTNTCEECVLTLAMLPHPAAPPLIGVNAQRICLNDPDTVPYDPTSPLRESEQYQLALVTGIIRALTMPVWLPEYPPAAPSSPNAVLAEGREGEWLALLLMLQEAEARHWLLPESERRALRNTWREELGGTWVSPFDGPLPFYPQHADPDARRRWLMVNLLIERAVEHGGDENTLGRLAHTLLAYRPETFEAERFFTALIGGSPADLELLSRGYVLTTE